MIKPIKIITNKSGWNTKILIDGKDITEEIGGIFRINIDVKVDALPLITIYRYGEKIDFESKAYKLDIKNYEPKKVKGKNISEITDMDCKGNREYLSNKIEIIERRKI